MVSFDYKMIVLKMIRKMRDEEIYVINTEHENSSKFIEAVKILIDQGWTWKFKKAFDIMFNTEMNKIMKCDLPSPSIWKDYFDARALTDKAIKENQNNNHSYRFRDFNPKTESYKKLFDGRHI